MKNKVLKTMEENEKEFEEDLYLDGFHAEGCPIYANLHRPEDEQFERECNCTLGEIKSHLRKSQKEIIEGILEEVKKQPIGNCDTNMCAYGHKLVELKQTLNEILNKITNE